MSLLDTHKAQHLYSNVVIDELFCSRGVDSHMKQTGMLVENFEFNP